MKKDTVIVTCPTNGDLELEREHAERLLAMPNNGGWVLKEKKQDAGSSDHTEAAGKPKKSK
jgi:hypothetical protein